jgi:hypothetical protein
LSSSRGLSLDVAPASPFIISKGRAWVTFMVKKVKWEKDEREKQKRWPRVWSSSSLSSVNSFSCSAETLWVLSFWPLHLLAQRAVAMLRPVCFCAVEDGWYMHPDLRREGVGGIVAVTLVTIEVWTSSWWNDRGHVGSERGSRVSVHYARSCQSHQWEWVPWLGAPMAPRLARGLHVSLGRGRSMPRGSGAPVLTPWGSGEAEIVPDKAQGSCALMTLGGLRRGERRP